MRNTHGHSRLSVIARIKTAILVLVFVGSVAPAADQSLNPFMKNQLKNFAGSAALDGMVLVKTDQPSAPTQSLYIGGQNLIANAPVPLDGNALEGDDLIGRLYDGSRLVSPCTTISSSPER
jgi:hypothetical protein